MPYDKPKVTIDLEEYNNLLKECPQNEKERFDKFLSLFKWVVEAYMYNGPSTEMDKISFDKLRAYLKKERERA